ncbi:SNF1-interacting protein [Didymella glomerata]|uniref:SNF1-interacting protein n=1 Tax=Didymella glomerata TaxID=749621 RepID=A0A9W8X5F0_9PLEO|nr:SNF1-interacting protein [Didymella glomerata]
MAEEEAQQPTLEPVSRPLALIPVVIKEAALDSPTFRATAVHFGDQIELVERWLDSYVRATSRLASELSTLQGIVDTYVQASHPPLQLSEAILDHDYTVLALKRFGEGAREYWNSTCRSLKRAETSVCEPIRAFLNNDLRVLKEARKNLDLTQRTFDGAIARYASQVKSKEASSLREDAFQLHEARRAYLQASMNFCVLAPQVRLTLDKVLVKVIHEQWRDMKAAKDAPTKAFALGNSDIERVRGWSKEMENGERVFKRELHLARQQVEQAAELSVRPSRDLDSYAASTVAYLGQPGPSSANLPSPAKPDPANEKAEKQGWLFQRTITGKPARTYWVRRWFFVKNGIFGWLTQGTRSGAVEESEKIGVLLCGIRPAFQEERRFCFEVKTKDTTILLQAETQTDITEWIAAFEVAKRKALEDTSNSIPAQGAVDAAFSISPPIAPEFAAKTSEGHAAHPSDEPSGIDRAETSLGIPGGEASRGASMDVSRRNTGFDRDGDMGRRDHAARIMEKLDLSRKSTAGPQLSGSNPSSATGGIASLISASLASASHNIVQVGQITAPAPGLPDTRLVMGQTLPYTSLSPNTLANPPAPTNLSKAAVAVSGEQGLGMGKSGNMPGGLMANLWGSVNWGYVHKIGKPEESGTRDRSISGPPSPIKSPGEPFEIKSDAATNAETPAEPAPRAHRKTISLGGPLSRPSTSDGGFPNYYPAALRMQDAQFRILFPSVPRSEKLVLVFRAVWNPTEQQEFPGRVYVTTNDIYFYSNHLGLVLVTGIVMDQIDEVTAAPGKDCDFLFLHFKTGAREDGATRITVKTFLEPLKLLQRRLNFLVRNATTGEHDLEEVVKALIKMEADDNHQSAGEEGWEEVSPDTPHDPGYGGKNIKTSLRIDGNLFGPSGVGANKSTAKFKLPSQPVVFAPAGMTRVAVEKEYEISAKGLFHILFGDKSAVFQLLYRERLAKRVVQGPWTATDKTHQRRDFEYEIAQPGKNGANLVINDYQVIEVMNDHLCYVVSDRKTPWYLPGHERFVLLSKVVITHVSKARCKLAVHTKIDWKRNPRIAKKLIERQGLQDLELEAQDLVDVVNDQVARLGHNRSTGKVTNIFGQIGVNTQAVQMNAEDIPPPNRPRKFKLQPTTTGSFIAQYVGNVIISILSTIMSWVLAIFAGIGNVVSAHKLLVALLLVSGGANFFYTSKDSWSWWSERNAAIYMSRLGVGPSTSMTRSVYLRDIAEAFANPNDTGIELALPTGSIADNKCHQTFTHLLDHPSSALSPNSMYDPTTYSTRRLERTRRNLGSQRHDLLVALRVVNRIEQEVVEAEYEHWLLDETQKCAKVGTMLDSSKKNDNTVQSWVKGYCGDCEQSLNLVREGRKGLI